MVGPVLKTAVSISGYENRMPIAKNRAYRIYSKPSFREFAMFGPSQKKISMNNGFIRIQRKDWFKHGVVTG